MFQEPLGLLSQECLEANRSKSRFCMRYPGYAANSSSESRQQTRETPRRRMKRIQRWTPSSERAGRAAPKTGVSPGAAGLNR